GKAAVRHRGRVVHRLAQRHRTTDRQHIGATYRIGRTLMQLRAHRRRLLADREGLAVGQLVVVVVVAGVVGLEAVVTGSQRNHRTRLTHITTIRRRRRQALRSEDITGAVLRRPEAIGDRRPAGSEAKAFRLCRDVGHVINRRAQIFLLVILHPPISTLFPYTTLFRSRLLADREGLAVGQLVVVVVVAGVVGLEAVV